MPTVDVVQCLSTSAESAWRRVEDVERFPDFMECVHTVEILEKRDLDGGRSEVVTGWEVELDGCLLRWVEREVRDPRASRIDFTQVSGDLSVYDGHWSVRPRTHELTDVELVVHFEIGIPLLRDVLDPYAEKAIRENSTAMLLSLSTSRSG